MEHTVILILILIGVVMDLVKGLSGRTCDLSGIVKCCDFFYNKDGVCEECQAGFQSVNGTKCIPCSEGFFGNKCADECKCVLDEICHHVNGCVNVEGTTQPTNDKEVGNDGSNKVKALDEEDQTVMIMSLIVASASLVIVLAIITVRCVTKANAKATMQMVSKQVKRNPSKGKANLYGSYHDRKVHAEDDSEFKFDREVEEDQYAMIRESQMILDIPDNDEFKISSECEQNNKECTNYGTNRYNHLAKSGATWSSVYHAELNEELSKVNWSKKLVTIAE